MNKGKNSSKPDEETPMDNFNFYLNASFFEAILEGSNEGIGVIDLQKRIIMHNQKFSRLLANTNQNYAGSSIHELIPDIEEIHWEKIHQIGKSNKHLSIRKNTASDYEIIYISEVDPAHSKLMDKYKETLFLKDMYEKIINSIDEGIHSIDTNGNLFIYNAAQEKREGYRASDVLGKHVTDVYNLDRTTSLLLKVLEEGEPIFDYHQEYTTKNGQYIDVLCSTVPLYSGNKIVGSAAILKDFSKFRQMAEKILYLQEKLTAKWSKTTSVQQKEKHTNFNQLIGLNKQFLESVAWAKAASKGGSPVLIYGETGTGKELFAQSIHEESPRRKGPFLAINCAAIPENLLEGILFGTYKGAFTGAINRVGLLEQASGGSLFLDEVNSMSLALQAKLLRVLEEKKVRRLGGNEETSIDTRIISSCNVTPSMAIERGQIRADLFYRLAVVYVFLPPLRERMNDLELLAKYFVDDLNRQLGKNILGIDHEVISAFEEYHWPGNIRQLKHTIECAMNIIPGEEAIISPNHIPRYLGLFNEEAASNTGKAIEQEKQCDNVYTILDQIKDQERERIISALKKSNGNMAKAAETLGLSRQLLRYRLKKLGLK